MAQGSRLDIGSSTAVRLTDLSFPNLAGLRVRASLNNTAMVFVAASVNITNGVNEGNDGYPLLAGDEIILAPAYVAYTDSVYVIAESSTQDVFWLLDYTPSLESVGWALSFSDLTDSGYISLF